MMLNGKKEEGAFLLRHLHILALGVIIFAASLPLMTNYCIDGVDVSFYLIQLQSVHPEELFFLLPSLLVRAGMPVEFVYKLFLFGLNIITAVAAYLCFHGIFGDRLTAAAGSMLYTWAPCRLNDLYCRADLGEAAALCFFPVVFYGLYRIYCGDMEEAEYKRFWILPALGYTLIVQSYLLSFLVIAGCSVLFCILMWKKTIKKQVLAVLAKTAAAFLACNLWLFVLLFLRMRRGTFPMTAFGGRLIQSGGVFPSVFLQLFFLNGSSFDTAGTGVKNMQPLGAGFAVTAGVLAYLWIVFTGRYRDKKEDEGIRFFAGTAGIGGAVMAVMALNAFPWDWLQKRNGLFFRLCESLHSPARLMPAVTLCFIVLTCTVLWQVKKYEKPPAGLSAAIVIIVLSVVSVQYLTGDILRTGEPRSLYGVEYGEPEGIERLLPENLDISPWDYGKYESAGG